MTGASDDPLLGRTLGGKYHLTGLLGRGGFGAVYLALQAPLDREVAVKVIRPSHGQSPDEGQRARFFREARVIAQLDDESIVRLYDYGEEPEDGLLYMVMERVRGRTLKAIFDEGGPMEPEAVVPLCVQILSGLAVAHGQGMVHRDLKPDNVMVVTGPLGEPRVKVLDFGIVKLLDEARADEARLRTGHGMVLGTPRYMAPEMATRRAVLPQSDLYALGVMIYELITGVPPFTGRTGMEVMQAHVRQKAPEPTGGGRIPPPLAEVVARVLQKKPEARYADAREMARALRATEGRPARHTFDVLPALRPETSRATAPMPQAEILAAAQMAERLQAPLAPPSVEEEEPDALTSPALPSPALPSPAVTGGRRQTTQEALVPSPAQPIGPVPVAPLARPVEGQDVGSTSRELMGEASVDGLEGLEAQATGGRSWLKAAVAGGIIAGAVAGTLLAWQSGQSTSEEEPRSFAGRLEGKALPPPTFPDAAAEMSPHTVKLGGTLDAEPGPPDAAVPDAAVARPASPDAGRKGPRSGRRRRRGGAKPFRIERL